jgi:hypothetical protein
MAWIRLGLMIALVAVAASAIADEPKPDDSPAPPETFSSEQRAHWAYTTPKRPDLPAVKDERWPKNPIDRFILSALEEQSFSHAPEADRVALLRRVTFDLTGLPPTAPEVDAYLKDARPDAYERLVDRLLASPAYGQRWAQHWLDLAHYADSNGFELDAERPDAWRYRDWVVNAFNDDMPYDRFLSLQIAGDELEPGSPSALIATGFGRSGPREVVAGNIDPVEKRQSELTEVTGTVGSVFLGLTMGCARCHNHKFDALPTTDYYRLQSFFAASEFVELPIATKDEEVLFAAATKGINEKLAPLREKQAALEAPYRKTIADKKQASLSDTERAVLAIPEKDRTPAQKKMVAGLQTALRVTWEEVAEAVSHNTADHTERERLKRAIHQIEITRPRPPAKAMALADQKRDAPTTRVLRRGDPKSPGPLVAPRPPGILMVSQPSNAFPHPLAPRDSTTGRRIALAHWLTRPDNPLTSRVIVNRLWQHHFGRGIVATPSDFGVRGEAPSHPELLDWLAAELVAQGWRLKPIHRQIVTSSTYRQSSRYVNATQMTDDPDNTLLWRMNRRRLEAESLRDAMLTVSGEINPKAGGPGVLAPIEKEVEDLIFTEAEVVDLWPETPDPLEHTRRSLYLFRKRNVRYPMFEAFDAPDTQTACPQRSASTHALQSLVLINSDFATGRAKALAGRVFREAGEGVDSQLTRAYEIVLARAPRPAELAQGRAFLESQAGLLRERIQQGKPVAQPMFVPSATEPAVAAAWVDFTLAMMNRNEFLYVP